MLTEKTVGESTPFDLVIVGAGAAGVCAAMEAGAAGVRTLVVEAFPAPGGAAATSGGGCCIVGTPLQAAAGIADSVDLALNDWLTWGGETADATWARFYLERSCQDLYVWLQEHGVVWHEVKHEEGNTVPRWHRSEGGGAGLMERLFTAAGHLPVDWRFATAARRLITADGRVTGIEVESAAGRETVAACAVLIATGGFTNNPTLLKAVLGDFGPDSRLLCGGARQSLGEGHRLLREVGAHFTHLDQLWLYPYGTPDYRDPTGTRGLAIRGVENEIWVNARGRRFHDESRRGGRDGTRALLAQTPRTCWSVFDRAAADGLAVSDPFYRTRGAPDRGRIEEFLTQSPFVHRSDSIAGLARAVGLPVETLVATVQQFNAWIAAGVGTDPEYGRNLDKLRPIQQPPFFAMQYFPLARKNFGGVRTDLSGRVLRPDGAVIPGLYAAGEVAGMAGGHINGRAGLEGTMLGPSLFSGRVAGRAAAQEVLRAETSV